MNSKYIDFMQIPELKEFTQKALEKYGDKNKLTEGESVAHILIGLLRKKKMLTENTHQSFVDVLVSAALLHNLFYDPEDWKTLFSARQHLEELGRECEVGNNFTSAIFQTIESQLGEDTPVPNCKPIDNSPTELFSYAVWFAKEYDPSPIQ